MTHYALGQNECREFKRAVSCEWLIINGIGGILGSMVCETQKLLWSFDGRFNATNGLCHEI